MARPKKVVDVQVVEQVPDHPECEMVVSKFDRFVDLVMNVEITQTPTSVQMHPWLEAQIESGLVLRC